MFKSSLFAGGAFFKKPLHHQRCEWYWDEPVDDYSGKSKYEKDEERVFQKPPNPAKNIEIIHENCSVSDCKNSDCFETEI